MEAAAALSGSGGVWVLGFGGLTVLLDVSHTFVLPSTIASVAAGVAGDELLFGEGEEVSTLLDELSGLHGRGSRESPA